MKLITIIGARPQFIKAAAVSRAFQESKKIEERILHTGQHHDANMSDVFFDELEIPKPSFHLGVHGGNHGEMTARMLEGIEKVYLAERPDCVLVYGDTNSTLAGALAASKMHIPVAHVEAGLRSFNKKMPEEINRIITDHISEILFAPTESAVKNLSQEGVSLSTVHNIGDVMYDAALYFASRAEKKSNILEKLKLTKNKFILSTIHRAENTNDPQRLAAIFNGLIRVSNSIPVILPLHPRTKQNLVKEGIKIDQYKNLRIIDPIGYLDMVSLEKNSCLIATDSGGVQKEAFFYGVPCVTLRDETEWIELVQLGWNTLVSPSDAKKVEMIILQKIGTRGEAAKPYGNGDSSQKICKILSER